LECSMSLKPHFLLSHLHFFLGSIAAVSKEHGERSHQDISRMEKDTATNGTLICWLITAGPFYGRHQLKNTGDKRRQNEFLILHLFIYL
jgi:hypothetical protein